MFKILDAAIEALNKPIGEDETRKPRRLRRLLIRTNRGLSNSLNNVLTVRADLGIKLDELGKLDALGEDRALGQTQQMSNLVDVDWNSVISSYTMQQAALQASYIKPLAICRVCLCSR